jgi:hypothetical protein
VLLTARYFDLISRSHTKILGAVNETKIHSFYSYCVFCGELHDFTNHWKYRHFERNSIKRSESQAQDRVCDGNGAGRALAKRSQRV